MGTNTNIQGRKTAREAIDSTSVFVLTDFDNVSLPTITLEEKLYIIQNTVSAGPVPYRFVFQQNATTSMSAINRLGNLLVSLVAVDAFFETAANSGNLTITIGDIAVIYLGAPAGSFLFDLAFLPGSVAEPLGGFGTLNCQGAIFRGFRDLGTVSNPQIIAIQNCFIEDYTVGFAFPDAQEIGIFNTEFISDGNGNQASIMLSGDISIFILSASAFTLSGNESVVRIDPGIPDAARISVSNVVAKEKAGVLPLLFDVSGDDGTYTNLVDSSPTSASITGVVSGSLVNGANAALFTTAGDPVFEGETVKITGFTGGNQDYNGTFRVTLATVSTFECLNVVFIADGTGTLNSDRVTITANAHGLSALDTLTIDTDQSTFYDGGAYIFDVDANNFNITRVFDGSEPTTGAWSTRGIDQTDPRVLAFNNSSYISSKYIGCYFVNDSTQVTTIAVQDMYQDLNFGGSLLQTSITERFKLIDTTIGIVEYTGNEPFEGALSFFLSATSTGSGSVFKFKFQHEIAGTGTFTDFTDNIETRAEIKASTTNSSLLLPVILNKGDRYKLVVKNVDSTLTITVSDISIYGE